MSQPKDETSNYWHILQDTVGWIKFADQKAALTITANGLIITLLSSNTSIINSQLEGSGLFLTILFVALISLIGSIIFSFLCVIPRLKKPQKVSIIYFENIHSKFKSQEEYYQELKHVSANSSSLEEQIAQHIFMKSDVATKKFKFIRLGLIFLALGALLLTIILFYVFFK